MSMNSSSPPCLPAGRLFKEEGGWGWLISCYNKNREIK